MTESEITDRLREAYNEFRVCNFRRFKQIVNETALALEQYPALHPLHGEFVLVASLANFSEPEKLTPSFRAALALIGGRSRVLSKNCPMSLDFFNVFGIYYRTGRADEIAMHLDRAASLFEQLTGGGTETAVCYRAQLAYYRGKTEEALPLAEKAYSAARESGNHLVALCAAQLIGNIAKHDRNEKLWNKMQFYIDGVISDPERRPVCIEAAECIRAEANMNLGVFKDIPDYIKNGDLGAVQQPVRTLGFAITGEKITPTSLYHAGITRIQYLFYNKKYIEAMNYAGLMRYVWKATPYPFGNAYIDFILASNYRMLGDMESAYFYISSAMEKIAPDGLWLIPAEFVLTSLGSFIIETAEKYDAKAGNKVRDLGVDYWNKIDDLRGIVHRESLISSLNDREYEVALLAADRLSSSEIAKQLYISESTVKFHLSNIFAKLGIKKKTEIAAALEKNLSHNFSLMKSRKEW